MVHRATSFPLNVSGLLLGIFAMATIAVSGAYTYTQWPLDIHAASTLRIVGWTLAASLFFLLLFRVRTGTVVHLRTVLLASAMLSVPLLLTQPVFAGDLYAYVAGAKVAAIGNPYVLTPSVLGTDVILNGVAPVWRGQPSAYGPAVEPHHQWARPPHHERLCLAHELPTPRPCWGVGMRVADCQGDLTDARRAHRAQPHRAR